MDKIHNNPDSTCQTNVLPLIYEHLTSWSHDMKKPINFGYIPLALNLNFLTLPPARDVPTLANYRNPKPEMNRTTDKQPIHNNQYTATKGNENM